MGLFDKLTGTKRPAYRVPPGPLADVRSALLAVERPTAPFVVRESDTVDANLVAEWRIADERWYEVFAKAGLRRTFRVLMRLDEERHEVRSADQGYSVEWRAGVPHLWFDVSKSYGQTVASGAAWTFTEHLRSGETYDYTFSVRELKQPLQQAVVDAGWIWKGIAFGKL